MLHLVFDVLSKKARVTGNDQVNTLFDPTGYSAQKTYRAVFK
jgi:hypothetical protein